MINMITIVSMTLSLKRLFSFILISLMILINNHSTKGVVVVLVIPPSAVTVRGNSPGGRTKGSQPL